MTLIRQTIISDEDDKVVDLTDNSNVPIELKNPDGSAVDVQHPVPTNGDRVYAKDIDVALSDIGNFSGNITDPFDNLHSAIVDDTINDPKEILFHFEGSLGSTFIGLGSLASELSNTEILLLNSGDILTQVVDESTDNEKYPSRGFALPPTTGANGILIRFHTTDQISISNFYITKYRFGVSRLQAVGEQSGLVEDITSFEGALNVTDGLVHKSPINKYFQLDDVAATTLAVGVTSQDITINVVSAAGLSVGDIIELRNGYDNIELPFVIRAIVVNAVTLNRPADRNYAIGDAIQSVVRNMAVDGSVTPVSFKIIPPTTGPESLYQVTRLLPSMIHASAGDDGKFGGIAALDNGVVIRTIEEGEVFSRTVWRTNGDMRADMFNLEYSDKAPAGNNGTAGRWTIKESEAIFELSGAGGDYMEALIQDDLTGLIDFGIKGQGRVFGK